MLVDRFRKAVTLSVVSWAAILAWALAILMEPNTPRSGPAFNAKEGGCLANKALR